MLKAFLVWIMSSILQSDWNEWTHTEDYFVPSTFYFQIMFLEGFPYNLNLLLSWLKSQLVFSSVCIFYIFIKNIVFFIKFCDVRKNFVNLHVRFPSTLKHFYILPSSHFILCFLLVLACIDTFLLNLQTEFHIHLSVIC